MFFNETKADDFWNRKLTLKVKFWHFLTAQFPLSMLILRKKKTLSNFVSPIWKFHNPYCHNVSIAGRVAGYSKRRSTWLVFPHGKVPRGLRSYKHLPYILYTIMTLLSNSPILVPSNSFNWECIGNKALSQMFILLSFHKVWPFSFFHYNLLLRIRTPIYQVS